MQPATHHLPPPASPRVRRSPAAIRLPAAMLTVWLLVAAPVVAAEAAETAQAPGAPTTAIEVDLDAIAAHAQEAVAVAMAEHEVPGGVFMLVADGEIAIAEGFGTTSIGGGTRVDPARTRFDVGSVAKLVTATAVLQQVERGRLDLDEDVNTYLTDLEIADTYPEPVTTADLLTHTAGFAEHLLVGMWAEGPGQAEPLAETLARHTPARIRAPGVVHQYSNFGMALAGHLVEIAADQPFEDYVHEQILDPLGMTRTTYGRPPAADAVDAVPHSAMAGPTTAVDPAYINWLPAGGLWTTGEDMAAFMLAHLQGGERDDTRILEAATVDAMHRTRFSPHPRVAGLGYGFFGDRHGAVQHGGGWVGTGAHLYLRPDLGVGMFTAFNHDDGPLLAARLHADLADRFLPPGSAPAPGVALDTPATDRTVAAGAFEGEYRWNRHDHSSFASLLSTLMISRLQVTEHPDGTLSTSMSPEPFIADTRWRPTGPGVFVEEDGTNVLAFDLDDEGTAVGLHVMGAQLFSMDRLAWYSSSGTTLSLLLATSLVLLIAAAGWPVGALVRRLRRTGTGVPSELRGVRRLSGVTAAVGVTFVLGLVAHLATDMAGLLQVSTTLRGLLWLPLLATGLTAGLAVLVARMWRRRLGRLSARLYHSVVLAALFGFLPLLASLRLLGFHL